MEIVGAEAAPLPFLKKTQAFRARADRALWRALPETELPA